ncbi:MAG: phenylalanine--tRNA ligase subunit beta [Candidatus Omnitrophota bacterium]
MKVSVNWLKDFLNIKVSPKVLAEKLTMAGLEVASQESYKNDVVFEIEITANRPDCLSILGIAQEVAAVLGTNLKIKNLQSTPRIKKSKKDKLKKNFISIQNKKDCVFYRGCLIKDVNIGPSPQWLRDRIEALGIRPVNNIVDITNYCLLEYGQPLHAFDYDKIVEQVVVRRARKGEKILAIDGMERQLSENILVISDKNKAIAIAGIMGDKLSEVGSTTKNILLESAYFNPILVRSGSRELGLSTESSYRFERQVDFDRVILAQDRAADLICQIAKGKLIDAKEAGARIKQKPREIKFDCSKVSNLLACDINTKSAKKIFESLGFSCRNSAKDSLLIKIPALRRDIKIEEDLVEELARIYGYNSIPSTLPAIRSAVIENSESENLKSSIREILCALGFSEAINYSLIGKNTLDKLCVEEEAVSLINPLSYEQEHLRPLLTAGLLSCLVYNINHKNTDLKLFELGHIFGTDYQESTSLGIVATGKNIDNWQIKKDFDFYALKGNVKYLINGLDFDRVEFSLWDEKNMFSQGEAVKIICQDKYVGFMGRVEKSTLSNFDIKITSAVYYAEIFLDELCNCKRTEKRFVPLIAFPAIVRDLSLIVKKSISYDEILGIIKEESKGYLRSIKLKDVYKGEQISAGSIGMTVSLELGLDNRTLTDDEATKIQQNINQRLKSEFNIQIR